jgi:hypothetical protein
MDFIILSILSRFLLLLLLLLLQRFRLCDLFASELIWNYGSNRIPRTGDQPFARPLPTQDNKHRLNAERHQFFEWDSNPRSKCLGGLRHFVAVSKLQVKIDHSRTKEAEHKGMPSNYVTVISFV